MFMGVPMGPMEGGRGSCPTRLIRTRFSVVRTRWIEAGWQPGASFVANHVPGPGS